MLTGVYRRLRFFMAYGWMLGLVLIVVTIVTGLAGFEGQGRDSDPRELLGWSDALYNSISLLAIQTGNVSTRGNGWLEVARWSGMAVWASAVLTLGIRLFREPVRRFIVYWLAKDHIIVAGLGNRGARLVESLRKQGRTVVVIEPNPNHPAVDQCARMGAVVLFGEPDDPDTLATANLPGAEAILALFPDESDCVDTATAVYEILHSEKATPRKPPVCCVLRLTEPGLLDVVRLHKIKTDSSDRIQLEILNSHEIAATTMVREAMANSATCSIQKLMILGLGNRHRLGEMIALRLAKDHLILNQGLNFEKLDVHVYDDEAETWLKTFLDRYPFVEKYCKITAHPCQPSKLGSTGLEQDPPFEAAFVCITDEGHAAAQAVMLRRDVLKTDQPIMVRVRHRAFGYGTLLRDPGSGWGRNIHPVGLEDALFDPDMATQPELELRAQAIHHHQYRLDHCREYRDATTDSKKEEIRGRVPNRPWHELNEFYREQNRILAEKYDEYLALVEGSKQRSYARHFSPNWFRQNPLPEPFEFSEGELKVLARIEHTRWLRAKQADGWVYGPVRDEKARPKTAPNIKEFDDLTPEEQRENLGYLTVIPRIFALADYWISESIVPSPLEATSPGGQVPVKQD